MNYLEIFDEIVSVTHHDYSGCIDKKGWDHPDLYRNQIDELVQNNQLTPEKFKEIVDDYLLDFKDSHMYFRLVQHLDRDVDMDAAVDYLMNDSHL